MIKAHPLPLRVSLQFDATLSDIRAVLVSLTDDMRAHGISSLLIEDTNIVLAEVLTNIARHGYPFQTGWIDCALVCMPQGIECQITDAGVAFDPSKLGQALPMPQIKAEGGYGWALIRALSEQVQYVRRDGQNHLSFVIPKRQA
jgi:serine/threonine-protein kinase RsbW